MQSKDDDNIDFTKLEFDNPTEFQSDGTAIIRFDQPRPLSTKRKVGRPKGVPNIALPGKNSKGGNVKFTNTKRKKFLEILEKTGNISTAAAWVGVHRDTVYKAISRDENFAQRVEISKGRSLAKMEEAAIMRGVDGIDEPIIANGEIIGYKKKYSDKMLEVLMKANDPDRYGGKQQTEINQNININTSDSAKTKLAELFGIKDVTPQPNLLEQDD